MTDTTQAPGQMAGNVLFYNKPEPLNLEQHGKLGVNPVEKPYGFVGKSNWCR